MNDLSKLDKELLELQICADAVKLSAIEAGFTVDENNRSISIEQNDNKELFEVVETIIPIARIGLSGFIFITTQLGKIKKIIKKILRRHEDG